MNFKPTNKLMNTRAWGAVAAAAMAACASFSAHAAGDDIPPLSLKLSETVTYDSNYSRTTRRLGEAISSTGVELGVDKPYGRQYYFGSARFAIDKHKNFKNQDNSNYAIGLGMTTGIASNWSASLSGNASENLNPNQENKLSDRLEKNVRKHSDAGMKLRYGVSGRWAVVGSATTGRTSYSLTSSKPQNQEQTSGGLQLVYSPSDLLEFGLGVSKVNSEYPNQFINGVAEEVKLQSIDLSSNWQVTGFSNLAAVLSFTESKYKSDPKAGFKGVTGNLDWVFTPKGLTTYKLGISRSTDSDNQATSNRTGASTDFDIPFVGTARFGKDTAYRNVVTAIAGSAKWVPTAKLSFTGGLSWNQYDITKTDNTAQLGLVDTNESTSKYWAASLASSYQFSRSLGFGCNYQHYKQTGESNPNVTYGNPRIRYLGNQYNCSASFKID